MCQSHPSEVTPEEFKAIWNQHQRKSQLPRNWTSIADIVAGCSSPVRAPPSCRVTFDDSTLTSEEYYILTGLSRDQFDALLNEVSHKLHSYPSEKYSSRDKVGCALLYLRTGLSLRQIGALMGVPYRYVQRRVETARQILFEWSQRHVGLSVLSRQSIITQHTSQLARVLLVPRNSAPEVVQNTLILVLDGTYIYCGKSSQYDFARATFCTFKKRQLVKPMVVVSTSGHIVSIQGPYRSNGTNSDSDILNHMLSEGHEFRNFVCAGDILVVDRGFQHVRQVAEDLGLLVAMPTVKAHPSTVDLNQTRLVTKTRWVVEAVNARMKTFRLIERRVSNQSLLTINGAYFWQRKGMPEVMAVA